MFDDQMKTRLTILAIALLMGTANAAPPGTLKGASIAFKLPPTWQAQRHITNGTAEVLKILIPDPDTDGTPDSSNAAITAEPLQPGLDVRTFGDSRLATKEPSFVTITDISAGEHWRTALSSAHQGRTPYIIVDRFGVADGWMVVLRAAFPIIERANASWTDRTLSEINQLIASLKINGTNAVNSELRQDKNMIWLRKYDDNWRPTDESLKKATYRTYSGASIQAFQAIGDPGSPQPER
jgi:hypothetical protein